MATIDGRWMSADSWAAARERVPPDRAAPERVPPDLVPPERAPAERAGDPRPLAVRAVDFFVPAEPPPADFLALPVRVDPAVVDRPVDAREPVLALEAMRTD